MSAKTFVMRINVLSSVGMFTQADHYEDVHVVGGYGESLETFAKRVARDGIQHPYRDKPEWIMPGAIVWIKEAE